MFLPIPNLLSWYDQNRRDLPWRADREPYHVWLSEIMLQQTRVEAVKDYYTRFLSILPDLQSLAGCPEDRLMKLWEGLGYYSRVRNLQKAAKLICAEHRGRFPDTYEAVRALPGVGDYTAGAVCSICYGLPTPAVDGNVLRVLARYWDIHDPVTRQTTKNQITEELRSLYPENHCSEFTQALMELGATVCLPNGAPACDRCPWGETCPSRKTGAWRTLPVKEPKKSRKIVDMTVYLLRCGEELAFLRRPEEGLLAGMWELPNEAGTKTMEEALARAEAWGCRPIGPEKTVAAVHIFTHVEWHMTGHFIACRELPAPFRSAVPDTLPIPTAFRKLLSSLPQPA